MSEKEGVEWDIRFPLLTNRYFMLDLVKVFGISVGVLTVILGIITRDLIQTLQFAGVTGGIMLVLMVFACLLLGNGYNATFYVGHDGIAFSSGSREKKWNRAAIVLGVLAGKPGLAGAGMLGSSGESGHYTWSEIQFITVDEGRRIISLHNNWRTLNRLYCREDNFEAVMEEFRKRLPKNKINPK